MGRLLSILFLVVGVHGYASSLPQTPCSNKEARKAESEAAYLEDAGSVYRSYKRFAHCDDGAIREGYSASIVRLLTQKWDRLEELDRYASSDKDFKRFVLRHIDELMTQEQQQLILDNSGHRCAKKLQHLCNAIHDAAAR